MSGFTVGSLFDGSGGFPLAASMCGGNPVWATEIEPYPIAVTWSRFPQMKHLGDVSKICGANVQPVNVITFGSPCQDLSIAGKRAGLKHKEHGDQETTRSGMFMEAVRIIKEMRYATNNRYPDFAIWENVPRAFSSHGGEDFRIVLEELVKIVEPTAEMPPIGKNGWPYADCYVGDGWSLAYRVFDAQYWGVPQRRRRIHLVLDLRGHRANNVLFEREGLRGYFTEGRSPWQAAAEPAPSGAPQHDSVLGRSVDSRPDIARSLTARADGSPCVDRGPNIVIQTSAGFKAGQSMAGSLGYQEERAATLSAESGGLEPTVCYTMKIRSGCDGGGKGALVQEELSATLGCNNDQYLFQPVSQQENYVFENHGQDARYKGPLEVCPMLPAQLGTGGNNTPFVVSECIPINDKATRYKGGGPTRNGDGSGNGLGVGKDGDPAPTLTACDHHAVCYAMQAFGKYKQSETASAIKARDYKDATDLAVFCAGVDCRNIRETPELYPTLQAKPNGGQSLNFSGAVRICYIVRRLTETECARLQGFADGWGIPDEKPDMTEEEYRFWLEVRNTHEAINKRPVRSYKKPQIIKWYNKLHTASAEYKMWGNGIALPPALYVFQGIQDAFNDKKGTDYESC